MSKCATEPCPSCPYRRDTPKGVWALEHYELLPKYDGTIMQQLHNGATSVFGCHYNNGNLCRGWLDCHGPENLLAMRLHGTMAREDYDIMMTPSNAEIYRSGKQVLEANLPHMENPSPEARKMMETLIKIPGKKLLSDD